MANEEHLAILKKGVEAWNQWRVDLPYVRPDLSRADLRMTNLGEADFSEANLSNANLRWTSLNGADLSFSDLSRADLSFSDLSRANLNMANFDGTLIGYTTLGSVDLNKVKGLNAVRHAGPSTIGIDTIIRSKGNIPPKFLLDAGVPQEYIDYLLPLAGKAIDFYSCFISHSSKDKPFAERLHADLQARGVRCWYAPRDLQIGEPFVAGIDKGIRLHDKLLLVLSEHSVASDWVQFEVNLALTKEKGKEPWVLFPIRLDNTVMETDARWAQLIRESRHIGDFTHWKDHDSYQQALERLLRDLSHQQSDAIQRPTRV